MLGVVAISGVGLIGGYFLASGAEEAPIDVDPIAVSAPIETDPSVKVVQVRVVKTLASSAAAADVSIDPGESSSAAAPTVPDFDAAFLEEGAPARDTGVAATAEPATPSAQSMGDEPPLVAAAARPPDNVSTPEPVTIADDAEDSVAALVDLGETETIAPPANSAASVIEAAPASAEQEPPVASVVATAQDVVQPSFRCSRAFTDTERAICADPKLAEKDRDLARIYRQVRSSAGGSTRTAVTDGQRAWLEKRDGCGGSTSCIRSAYEWRIRELQAQLR